MDKIFSLGRCLLGAPSWGVTRSKRWLTLWFISLIACVGLGLASVIYSWSGLPLNVGGVDVYITVYPPLVICLFWVIWAGFWWGFVPAYVATFILALYSGVPVGWSSLFAFADPLGLAVFGMVYSAIPISSNLRSLNSIVLFVLLSFVSSIIGSSGAFIWVYSNSLGITDMYSIWQGWWLGAFLQNMFLVAPILFLFGRRVEAIKRGQGVHSTEASQPMVMVAGAVVVASVLLYLYLAIEMSSQKLFSLLPETSPQAADLLSASTHTIYGVMTTLIVFFIFFGYRLAMHWSSELKRSALALASVNTSLRAEVMERRLLTRELEQRVELRTQELVMVNDDLSKAIKVAEQANRAKSDFLANMCHEIRTPMNGVLGMAEMLKSSPLDTEQQKCVSTIERSGHTLMVVVNDILDYSKIEANKLQLLISSFELQELLDDVTAPYRSNENMAVALCVTIDDDIPKRIKGDVVRLHQVLNNLLHNAFKFTQRGRVDLKLTSRVSVAEQSQLVFVVQDTGIGISSELLPSLFEPFTQEDESSSRQYGGTGLGLSICRRLVDLMSGEILVESEQGKGSRFEFAIVLEKGDAVVSERQQDSAEGVDRFDLNVLLAEDNPVNQAVMSKMMEKLGATVEVVANGQLALASACQHSRHYDLILMDCEMPMMDGYEATQKIRQWERDNDRSAVLISALTAHVLPEHIERSKQAGMDHHIPKPTSLADLREILQRAKRRNLASSG